MGHLIAYNEAVTEKDRALAALDCSLAKSSRSRAWNWAEIAAKHAEACGITNAKELLGSPGSNRWPELDALRAALEAQPVGATPDIAGVLSLAAKLPSGLNDPHAAEKLLAERDEFFAAIEVYGDKEDALTEAADAVYYAVKHLDWVARQVELDIDGLFRLAVAKYSLRARPGNPKNDRLERRAVVAAAKNLTGGKWYHFRVHKINEDYSIEAHFNAVKSPKDDAINPGEVRQLSPVLADLPGPNGCLWEGYVKADNKIAAQKAVEAAI